MRTFFDFFDFVEYAAKSPPRTKPLSTVIKIPFPIMYYFLKMKILIINIYVNEIIMPVQQVLLLWS